MSGTPALSVALIVGNQRQRAARALDSILTQASIDQVEVILIDAATITAPPLPGSDHPAVRCLRVPERPSFGAMRADAVKLARGAYVVSLEEHCIALPGWLEGYLARAAEGVWTGIGGEIQPLNPGPGVGDATFSMHYPPDWRTPARPGRSEGVPGHNSAYRREALLQFGADLPDLLQNESLLWWKLMEQGAIFGIEPAIKFQHRNETLLFDLVQGYYHMHRSYGYVRAKLFQWSFWLRWLRLLSLPLLPVVRLLKYVYRTARQKPSDLKMILRDTVVLLTLQTVAGVGLGAGYLFGPGQSDRLFTVCELDLERGEARESH